MVQFDFAIAGTALDKYYLLILGPPGAIGNILSFLVR